MDMKTKICTKCGIEKDLEKFYNKNLKDGKRSICKECVKKHYELNKERISKQHKEHYNSNKEIISKRNKQYQKLNKEVVSKQQKEYQKLNKVAISKRKKEYYKLNKEEISNWSSKYYKLNKEVISMRHKEYDQTSKGKATVARARHNRRIKENNTLNDLTSIEWTTILQLQDYQCIRCNTYFDEVNPTRDHIVPVEYQGGLTKDNVQALCGSCNSSKGIKNIDYRSERHKEVINEIF